MKKIYLIDGNSFIYRMFFGLPEFSTKDGKIVNAVFGMAKFFVGQLTKEKPDYLIFIKDAKGDNFRHSLYTDYKATRDRMPDNLKSQIGDIEEMIKMMGIDIVDIQGYEADDIIGTLAKKYCGNKEYEVDILTGDKDLYSLVSDNVKIYDTMKKKKFGPNETEEKFGIKPNMIIDYLSIVGDKSDNIPGIDGFGPQKAVNLINIIGGIEEIYLTAEETLKGKKIEDIYSTFSQEEIKVVQGCFKGKTFEKLINSKDNAFLSKKLATLDLSVNLENFDLESFRFKPENLINNDVKKLFKNYEFNSLINDDEKKLQRWDNLNLKVKIIGDKGGLSEIKKKIKDKIVLDTETTSLNIIEANLVGISIYIDDENIYYINRLHPGAKIRDDELKFFLKDLLSMNILIIGHNIKYDLEIIELFLKNENKYVENKGEQMSIGL
ncbi:hypothetical protein CSB07_01665 [Candidatus Gracilibacteria bacterium]|nr:MAG: hypothetical protein CSB07_01665 [Candidatus Gracilibacteria bacterium]